MRSELVFRPQAQAELLAARDWYESRRAGLGADFGEAIDKAIQSIVERPLAYPCVHGEIRRVVLRRFPYGVFFRVLPDHVVILGVIHDRRHPQLWQSRR